MKTAVQLHEAPVKPQYGEIGITDVCAPRGVARTTFYRLFDTLDDVLIYQFDTLFEESFKQYTASPATEKSYAKILLHIAMSNKPLLTAIIHSGRNDLFDFSTGMMSITIHLYRRIITELSFMPVLLFGAGCLRDGPPSGNPNYRGWPHRSASNSSITPRRGVQNELPESL